MQAFMSRIRAFSGEEEGNAAVEYALVLALICGVLLYAVSSIGARMRGQ